MLKVRESIWTRVVFLFVMAACGDDKSPDTAADTNVVDASMLGDGGKDGDVGCANVVCEPSDACHVAGECDTAT